MADYYTPLINQLLQQVAEHPDFNDWRLQGKIPANAVDETFKSLKDDSPKDDPLFSVLPARVQKSAVTLVKRTYKSWFKLRSRLSWQIEGQTRWLEILKSDDDLLKSCNCDLETLHRTAVKLLSEIEQTVDEATASDSGDRSSFKKASPKTAKRRTCKTKQKEKPQRGTFKLLIERYRQEEDNLTRGAIAYLLKYGGCVPKESENPEKFAKRRRKAEIRLERLLRKFQRTRLPQGRNLSWQPWLEALAQATEQMPQDEDEAADWQANLLRSKHPLPFPINYETTEDLIWSITDKGRLQVTCSGFGRRYFEIYCDQRDLHWFKRFLEDQHVKRKSRNQHSASLFTLRSGRIAWREGKGDGAPWDANSLTLFCTVETRFWTQEGTNEVKDEKVNEIAKVINGTKSKGNLTKTQEEFIKRKEKTLSLIENSFPRPSKPRYQGNPSILAGVSYGRDKPATVAIVDISKGKAIAYRSIRQLLGTNYRLLNRYRLRQTRNAHRRHNNQKKSASNQIKEYRQREHLDRLIAHAIVTIAEEFRVSSIVLPDLGNIREAVEAEIQAKAEQTIPGCKEAQQNYAKQYRSNVHLWSYSRLSTNIQSQASQANVSVEKARQPFHGTPQEKARELAIAAYKSRKDMALQI